MKTAFESILEKAPWLVRWVFYIFWAGAVAMSWLFWQGWSAKDKSDKYFSAIANDVFTQRIAPINSERNTRFGSISSDISEIKSEQKIQGKAVARMEGMLIKALEEK